MFSGIDIEEGKIYLPKRIKYIFGWWFFLKWSCLNIKYKKSNKQIITLRNYSRMWCNILLLFLIKGFALLC